MLSSTAKPTPTAAESRKRKYSIRLSRKNRQRTAPGPALAEERVRIVHPFHPLAGEELRVVEPVGRIKALLGIDVSPLEF